MKNRMVFLCVLVFVLFGTSGCGKFWGGAATGAAVGAAGVGAAYEYQNKEQMDKLDDDFEKGNITKEEYYERKKQIEDGSIIY